MPESYLSQAEVLAEAGQIGEAILLLEEAVETNRETAGIAKLLARLSLRINEVRAFQNWCHEALRMDPNDIEVYQMMEDYFRSVGRDFEADEVREVAQNISQRG
jgi:Tfp pilus assembly protein PilF